MCVSAAWLRIVAISFVRGVSVQNIRGFSSMMASEKSSGRRYYDTSHMQIRWILIVQINENCNTMLLGKIIVSGKFYDLTVLIENQNPYYIHAGLHGGLFKRRFSKAFWKGWKFWEALAPLCQKLPPISSGPVFMINTRAQRKLLHTWIILMIVKHCQVQIGRIDGPTEYLS